MSKMVKEIAGLCYHLDKLYSGEKDKKIKKEIDENFYRMSALLDRAIRSQLDEHDPIYKKNVRKIRKYSKEIESESERLAKYEQFFSGLNRLGEQLDELLEGRD